MAVQFEIHPSIGIARLGTSSQFFLAPVPGAAQPATHRDASNKLLKQAARFQVFRCDRDAAGHLTGAPVAITTGVRWTIQVANRKSAAAVLQQPAGGSARRNHATGNDVTDRDLIIAPMARTLDASNPESEFADGKFRGLAVMLGHAKLQSDGSLIFIGGSGVSASRTPTGGAVGLTTFADNNDWFDDTCEGPVTAQVQLPDGSISQALAARVIVAPPDFAPEVTPWVTLYDIAYQVAIDRGFLQPDAIPSFSLRILPFLRRALAFPWVNARAASGHAGAAAGNFLTKFAQLGDPSSPIAMRQRILARFRAPTDQTTSTSIKMPRFYSEQGYPDAKKVIALPPVFFHYFEQWVAGTFTGDLGADPFAGESLVDAIDRVSLEACVGGGFFPGIEVPRFVLDKNNWSAPFRLNPAIPAGRVTEGLAIPWQADFSACAWEGASVNDPSGFAWWPAQRPDHVFKSAADVAANHRVEWDRGATGATGLIAHYSDLGFVVRQTTAGQDMFVERERVLPEPLPT